MRAVARFLPFHSATGISLPPSLDPSEGRDEQLQAGLRHRHEAKDSDRDRKHNPSVVDAVGGEDFFGRRRCVSDSRDTIIPSDRELSVLQGGA